MASSIDVDMWTQYQGNSVEVVSPIQLTVDKSNFGSQTTNLLVDLTFSDVYVPAKQGGSFGIDCTQDKNCFQSGQPSPCSIYRGVQDTCTAASTFLRFDNMTLSNTNQVLLNLKTISGTTNWRSTIGDNGVLGLAPNSPLWTFLTNAYNTPSGQDYFDLSLMYKIKDLNYIYDESKISLANSKVTVNGKQSKGDTYWKTFPYSLASTAWSIPGTRVAFWKNDPRAQDTICIDNTANYYFLVGSQKSSITQEIFNQLCGNSQGCKKSDSKAADVDDIRVFFNADNGQTLNLRIAAKNFVSYDSNDNALLGIGDIATSVGCKSSQIAFGRLFFSQVELTIRSKDQKTFSIGVTKIDPPSTNVTFLVLINCVFAFVAVIIAFVIVKVFVKKQVSGLTEAPSEDEPWAKDGGLFNSAKTTG